MSSTISISRQIARSKRIQLTLRGTLQGIGFRPFVFRLAQELMLGGWIANTTQGVLLELEGSAKRLRVFQERMLSELPEPGAIQDITSLTIPSLGEQSFAIRASQSDGYRYAVLSPDLATCQACLNDLQDPHSRRYQYPFTTCAHCGPRYSIVHGLPYDRSHTAMSQFPLCHNCQEEFENPLDRRFHAETMTCPACGPEVALWDRQGKTLAAQEEAWKQACDLIRHGRIVAVKGLGGFQLWVDAFNPAAVIRLRTRKHRPDKPFAVLFPSMPHLQAHCEISPEEEQVLKSSASPIVLLKKRIDSFLATAIAPKNPYVGAMLPFTPLHHLMATTLGFPVVATSGNRSEEPLVYQEQTAVTRLGDIADAFLVHNRPIIRPIDDSVVRVMNGKPMMLRRARGYAPSPLQLSSAASVLNDSPILAVGGHLKNTIAIMNNNQIIASPHIGDLSTVESITQFEQTVDDLLNLYHCAPQAIACDAHPDYRSTHFARAWGMQRDLPIIPVYHHHAHITACLAEHQLTQPVLGVAWDGIGYGPDQSLWGGEFLLCQKEQFTQVGTVRPFSLPGGEICMREPRRVALSLLYEIYGENLSALNLPPLHSLGPNTVQLMTSMIQRRVNCPMTSSIGRLFDGISALLGLSQTTSFEGQAALGLEYLAQTARTSPFSPLYSLPIRLSPHSSTPFVADWEPLVRAILQDMKAEIDLSEIAWRFHQTLAHLIVTMAEKIGCPTIALSGGVFQNSILACSTEQLLTAKGMKVVIPHLFGPHDGGLSIGQCLIAGQILSSTGRGKSSAPNTSYSFS